MNQQNKIHPVKSCEAGSPMAKFNRVKKPYLLYVGNAYPHKNLERLLQAFRFVLKENPNLSLVLVGRIDYFYNRLQEKVRELDLDNKIIFTDRVSDKILDDLYKNALVYIFPSLSEGFGLPGLEAMKQGLPVVCSNQGPLPEIYGRAAVYFNGEDIREIAQTILQVISNNSLRENMRKHGYLQVKKYSWQRCAQQTLDVYGEILKKEKI
ncbi:glycosyltransferase family 4 protein [Patescibacteria group bacterium]|nr:glycosyltransferase family 4 protein [Patescibacteria group bacterium]